MEDDGWKRIDREWLNKVNGQRCRVNPETDRSAMVGFDSLLNESHFRGCREQTATFGAQLQQNFFHFFHLTRCIGKNEFRGLNHYFMKTWTS